MGLRDAIAATAGTAPTPPPPHRTTFGGARPTCTNCRTDNHNRCPTAITHHGQSDWTSDFDCECYHRDVEMHADLVEADDEEFNAQREGHFGRVDWDSEGRQAWDSVGGQFPDDW